MTGPELQLVEMLQEILDDVRWMQILAYTNQYLLNEKLQVSQEERDQILEAATRAVDKDAKLHEWSVRLDRLKAEIANIKQKVGRARKEIRREAPTPPRLPFPEPPAEGLADAAES